MSHLFFKSKINFGWWWKTNLRLLLFTSNSIYTDERLVRNYTYQHADRQILWSGYLVISLISKGLKCNLPYSTLLLKGRLTMCTKIKIHLLEMIYVSVGIFALTQTTVPYMYMYIQIYLYIKHSNTWLGFSCKVDCKASFDWGRGCRSSYYGHGTAGNNLQIRHVMLLHTCTQHKWGKKKSFCH